MSDMDTTPTTINTKPDPDSTPPTKKRHVGTPRQRACTRCHTQKQRCDLEQPACSRCRTRHLDCIYLPPSSSFSSFDIGYRSIQPAPAPSTPPVAVAYAPRNDDRELIREPVRPESTARPVSPVFQSPVQPVSTALQSRPSEPLLRSQFTDVSSAYPVHNKRISLRWLSAFVEDSHNGHGPRVKQLSPSTVRFCSQYLRTLPYRLLEGPDHPIIHHSQLSPAPSGYLVNAMTLVRMYRDRIVGSEALVRDTLRNEQDRIMSKYMSLNGSACLAAFQSYLILSLLAYFHMESHHIDELITVQTFMSLQALCDRVDELLGAVPPIQSHPSQIDPTEYVEREAFRRTVYATCVFDNIWNANMSLPTYTAEDLGKLLAPCSKELWFAWKPQWMSIWREYETRWKSSKLALESEHGEVGLKVDEIWGKAEGERTKLEARFDEWLGNVDEFGMWMLAVCEMMGSRG